MRRERLIKFIVTPIAGEFDTEGNLHAERPLPQQVLYYPFDLRSLLMGWEQELEKEAGREP